MTKVVLYFLIFKKIKKEQKRIKAEGYTNFNLPVS